jgi:CubicO group peptidase (beta-lactamase class C family)
MIAAMSMTRRHVLGASAAVLTAAAAGCGREASTRHEEQTSTGGTGGGAAAAATPSYVAPLKAVLTKYLKPTAANPKHPTYAGAALVVMVNNATTASLAVGHALRYGAGPVELAPAKRVAMRTDSIFDLASLTKVYVSVLLLQQVDKGKIILDTPVVRYLPGFTGATKNKVTVRMLLTHTSGLPVGATGVKGLNATAQRAKVLATPLVSGAVPGKTFRYSSVGLMVAAQLVEKVTGQSLEAALKTGITTPMGSTTTGFNPLKWLSKTDQAAKLAATDRQRRPVRHRPRRRPARTDAPRRRRLRRQAVALRHDRPADADQPQRRPARHRPGTPRPPLPPRARRDARPTMVHGRAVIAHHLRPHRLHRHVPAGRPPPQTNRLTDDQPRPPELELGEPRPDARRDRQRAR